jgi:hypothetical protein
MRPAISRKHLPGDTVIHRRNCSASRDQSSLRSSSRTDELNAAVTVGTRIFSGEVERLGAKTDATSDSLRRHGHEIATLADESVARIRAAAESFRRQTRVARRRPRQSRFVSSSFLSTPRTVSRAFERSRVPRRRSSAFAMATFTSLSFHGLEMNL